LIHRGLEALARSAAGAELSEYHCEAGIAAVHARAARFADTDWPQTVRLYDRLYELNPSPVIALNRAIAIGFARGAPAALAQLRAVAKDARLKDHFLLHAALGRFHADAGATDAASAAYARAHEAATNESERRFVARRLDRLGTT
jgi:RNA polymerase sigma-70 factor (ECF subfamily)